MGKRFRYYAGLPAGLLTARWRRLPDFMIIGAQKGGTTSLYEYLVQHPDVLPALTKETHFFSLYYGRGMTFYKAHFPLEQTRASGSLCGEATPYYLFHPNVPELVRAHTPTRKFIVLLRDPVERAYSQYWHERRRGFESLELADALARESCELPVAVARLRGHPRARSMTHLHHTYVSRGLYAEQLERWFSNFPRSSFLIERSEDFFARPAETFSRVLDFLGLRPFQPAEFEKHNVGIGEGVAPPEARALLAPRFTEANARLERLLGRDMHW